MQRILGDADLAPDAISYLVHGTTVATNSIIEGKTPHTAFIITEGFRDMLEIGWQVLRLRPVYHRAVHRIHAHIALTVIALLLERMPQAAPAYRRSSASQ